MNGLFPCTVKTADGGCAWAEGVGKWNLSSSLQLRGLSEGSGPERHL